MSGQVCEAVAHQRESGALADDMLEGAKDIDIFLGLEVRQVHHRKRTLSVFFIGAKIFARKSTLLAWIVRQEQRGAAE